MEESRGLIPRLLRAAGLEPEIFQEIAADREATAQAALVVVLAGLCAGLGTMLAGRGAGKLIDGTVTGLVTWLVWSWFAYAAGVLVCQGTANYGRLLRAVGLAHAPLLLRVLRFVPGVGGALWEAASLWAIFAGVIAVREALGLNTARALAACLVGWVAQRLVFAALLTLLGPFSHFLRWW